MSDKDVPVGFPLRGVHAASGVGRQPPGTAAAAQNVRATEALTTRTRGGSRPGLTRFIDATVDGLAGHPVQMLDAIVDPTVDAALTSFEAWDDPADPTGTDPGVDDPSDGARNPGRLVRPGGSGVQPNRHVTQRRVPASGPRYVQSAIGQTGGVGPAGSSLTVSYPGAVVKSNLLVALAAVSINASVPDLLTDSRGNNWRLVRREEDALHNLLLCYCAAAVDAGACDVTLALTVQPGEPHNQTLCVLEYKQVNPVDARDASAAAGARFINPTGSISPGPVAITANDDLLLGLWDFAPSAGVPGGQGTWTYSISGPGSPPAGVVRRQAGTDMRGGFVAVVEWLPADTPGPRAVALDYDSGGVPLDSGIGPWMKALAVTFKKR